MDDLLNNLNSFNVTHHINNPNAEHPRFAQFKVKRSGSSQEERRLAVLAARREGRYDLVNHLRHLEEGAADEEEDEEYTDEALQDDMDCDQAARTCYLRPRKYRNFLMLSEWLVDVPEDFAKTYTCVPCPVGKRCLIVAARGQTTAYGKNGALVHRFSSYLPGGGPLSRKGHFVLMDCILNLSEKTCYMIDLIAWKNQSVMQCETTFRFEWLNCRLSELDEDITVISPNNSLRFVHLPHATCSPESLRSLLEPALPFALDGVLFYHRESHYTHGPTPLVGWLKAYMFPEILGVSVPQNYLLEKPQKYVNLPEHIKYAEALRESRKESRQQSYQKMELNSSGAQSASTARKDCVSQHSEVKQSEGLLDVEN